LPIAYRLLEFLNILLLLSALTICEMAGPSIQDRTGEFHAILGQAQKRVASSKVGTQRQALLSDSQRRQANGSADGNTDGGKRRSEFARRAAEIGRGITATTAKLRRLAERKSEVDTKPSWE
jgi:syntaxin 5